MRQFLREIVCWLRTGHQPRRWLHITQHGYLGAYWCLSCESERTTWLRLP